MGEKNPFDFSDVDDTPIQPRRASDQGAKRQPAPRPRRVEIDEDEDDYEEPVNRKTKSREQNNFESPAIVLSAIGFIAGFISPCVCWVFCGAGFVLGVISLSKARSPQSSIVALVLSMLGTIIGFFNFMIAIQKLGI